LVEHADGPDALKHFAGVRALQVLQALYLDQDWIHVIEAIEESERVNPSLHPVLVQALRLLKDVLPKSRGGRGGRSPATHRNLLIIAYAFEIQLRTGRLLLGGEINDLLESELDLIVWRFAPAGSVGKPDRAMMVEASGARFHSANHCFE
jgi:hypothetical protein